VTLSCTRSLRPMLPDPPSCRMLAEFIERLCSLFPSPPAAFVESSRNHVVSDPPFTPGPFVRGPFAHYFRRQSHLPEPLSSSWSCGHSDKTGFAKFDIQLLSVSSRKVPSLLNSELTGFAVNRVESFTQGHSGPMPG
jgi:hypothetical protein